jgi:small-conductance mechanosensitive channel
MGRDWPLRIDRALIAALGLLVLAAPVAASAAARETPDAEGEAKIASGPVTVDGEVLFRVRGVTAMPADVRARQISERIAAIAADPTIPVDALRIVEVEGRSDLLAGEHRIATVVDADAEVEDVGRQTLAVANLSRIRDAIEAYRRERSSQGLWRAATRSGVATVVLAIAALLAMVLGRRIRDAVDRRYERRIRSITIQSLEVVQAARIHAAVHNMVDGLRAVTVVSLVLAWVSYVLAQFPWTRPAGRAVVLMFTSPLRWLGASLLNSLPDLVFLAVLIVVARYVLKVLLLFFGAVERGTVKLGKFDPEWTWPTYRVVRLLIVALALAVAFPYIPGSNSEAFRGISIFLGVVFSLGASGVVGNVIAGYSMIYRRTFRIGDRVKIRDVVGDVTEMRLQVTHLRTTKNEEVIVPNSQILDGEVVNYSSYAREGKLILHATVGINYAVPWRQVEAMLVLAAERTEGLLREPPPFVNQKALGDFAVTYEINVYCGDAHAMARLYTALYRSILDVFNEYGVQIMTPAYEGDPERPKVVPKERWFESPARQDAG